MIKRVFGLLVTAFILSIPVVQAEESPLYFGIDWGDFNYDEKGTLADKYDSANGFSLRLGYDFNNYFAIEGHVLLPDEFESTTTANLNLDYGLSAFARGNLRFQRVTVYAIAGITHLKSGDASDESVGYGAGLDFYGSRDTAFTFAYTSYYVKEKTGLDTDFNAFTVGVTHYLDVPKFHKRY